MMKICNTYIFKCNDGNILPCMYTKIEQAPCMFTKLQQAPYMYT